MLDRELLVEGVKGDFFAFLGVAGGGVEGSSLGDKDPSDTGAARLVTILTRCELHRDLRGRED